MRINLARSCTESSFTISFFIQGVRDNNYLGNFEERSPEYAYTRSALKSSSLFTEEIPSWWKMLTTWFKDMKWFSISLIIVPIVGKTVTLKLSSGPVRHCSVHISTRFVFTAEMWWCWYPTVSQFKCLKLHCVKLFCHVPKRLEKICRSPVSFVQKHLTDCICTF